MTVINQVDYLEAAEQYLGWCTECEEFTRDCTEPDATGYDCPECDGHTVVGAEQALLEGLFTFKEDTK